MQTNPLLNFLFEGLGKKKLSNKGLRTITNINGFNFFLSRLYSCPFPVMEGRV